MITWAVLLPAAGWAEGESLLVHAASSLRGVCEDLRESYRHEAPGVDLRFNFGSSSDLAGQILAGVPGDLFLAADSRQVARLGQVDSFELCSNRLVVVEPAKLSLRMSPALESAQDLKRVTHLSIAEPSTVPAGIYARQWLSKVGLWQELESRCAPAMNARAALAAVESGACQAGVLYGTDAHLSEQVRIAFEIPASEQPAIRYGAALLLGSTSAASRDLFTFLQGATVRGHLARHGFLPALAPAALEALPEVPASSPWVPLWISLKVAGFATLLTFLPGSWLGWILARKRFPGRSLLETFVALPLVLPPTAIGYLLLRSFAGDSVFGARLDLLLTWQGAVIAASLMSLPLVARTARVAFEGVDPRLESMGASLGWSRLQVLSRVTWPLARRGLAAGAILGFSRALGEFGATVIVAGNIPGETQTLALAIFQDIQLGRDDRALQLLGLSVLLAFACVWSVEFLSRKAGSNGGQPR